MEATKNIESLKMLAEFGQPIELSYDELNNQILIKELNLDIAHTQYIYQDEEPSQQPVTVSVCSDFMFVLTTPDGTIKKPKPNKNHSFYAAWFILPNPKHVPSCWNIDIVHQ